MDIYQQQIIDLYKNPLNKGNLEDAQIIQHESNSTCGDDITLYIKFNEKDEVQDIKFEGQGCTISQASASLLTEEMKGKKREDLEKINKEDIIEMLGIELSPTRLKCALLILQALSRGLKNIK